MIFYSDFFNSQPQEQQVNTLLQYLQQQKPEILARVAQSASPEVKQIISHNVRGLVGMLPSEDFNIQITTDRENLATLLASAMMTGYFLRQMEQRRDLETTLSNSDSLNSKSSLEEDAEGDNC
jgi:23S rRNA G2069 N7-methylase RlmK/C1962 C5-methylase RlmI